MINDLKDKQKEALDSLESSFKSSFDTIFDGTKNWKEKMATIFQDLGKTLLQYVLTYNQTQNSISQIPLANQTGQASSKGSVLKTIGNAASTALLGIPLFHSGGIVPGNGEVLSLLKGGETVRTQGQEVDVQKKLNGEGENQAMTLVYAPTFKSLDPAENMRMAKQDERRIIDLITDAVQRNRQGIRTVIRGV